jgi:hypothetical protein
VGGRSRRRRTGPSGPTSTGAAPRTADRPKPGRPAPDAGAAATDGAARRAPYIVLVAALSMLLLVWRAHMSAMVCDVVILTVLLVPLGRLVHHHAT